MMLNGEEKAQFLLFHKYKIIRGCTAIKRRHLQIHTDQSNNEYTNSSLELAGVEWKSMSDLAVDFVVKNYLYLNITKWMSLKIYCIHP